MKKHVTLLLTTVIALNLSINAFAYEYSTSSLFGSSPKQYSNYIENTNNSVNSVAPDYFNISRDGNLIFKKIDYNFVNKMHDEKIKVIPFISNYWDKTLGISALNNSEVLTTQIANQIYVNNLDGINVDIENLSDTHKDAYTNFVKLLRKKMPDKTISVSVAANPNSWKTGWHGSYDYKALSEVSDYLLLMAYDESYFGSPRGPVASSTFVEKSIIYALNETSPDKVVLGIPFFGRYWKSGETTGGRAISSMDVENLINNYPSSSSKDYDENSKSAKVFLTLKDSDIMPKLWGGAVLTPGKYEIWYDDINSTRFKLGLVEKYKLRGSASWALNKNNIDARLEESKSKNDFGIPAQDYGDTNLNMPEATGNVNSNMTKPNIDSNLDTPETTGNVNSNMTKPNIDSNLDTPKTTGNVNSNMTKPNIDSNLDTPKTTGNVNSNMTKPNIDSNLDTPETTGNVNSENRTFRHMATSNPNAATNEPYDSLNNINDEPQDNFGTPIDNLGSNSNISSNDTTNSSTGLGNDTTNSSTGLGNDTTNSSTGLGNDTTNSSTGLGNDTTNSSTGLGNDTTNSSTGSSNDTTNPSTGLSNDTTNPSTGLGNDTTNSSTGLSNDTTNSSRDLNNTPVSTSRISNNSATSSAKSLGDNTTGTPKVLGESMSKSLNNNNTNTNKILGNTPTTSSKTLNNNTKNTTRNSNNIPTNTDENLNNNSTNTNENLNNSPTNTDENLNNNSTNTNENLNNSPTNTAGNLNNNSTNTNENLNNSPTNTARNLNNNSTNTAGNLNNNSTNTAGNLNNNSTNTAGILNNNSTTTTGIPNNSTTNNSNDSNIEPKNTSNILSNDSMSNRSKINSNNNIPENTSGTTDNITGSRNIQNTSENSNGSVTDSGFETKTKTSNKISGNKVSRTWTSEESYDENNSLIRTEIIKIEINQEPVNEENKTQVSKEPENTKIISEENPVSENRNTISEKQQNPENTKATQKEEIMYEEKPISTKENNNKADLEYDSNYSINKPSTDTIYNERDLTSMYSQNANSYYKSLPVLSNNNSIDTKTKNTDKNLYDNNSNDSPKTISKSENELFEAEAKILNNGWFSHDEYERNKYLTRGEAIKIIMRMASLLDKPSIDIDNFNDVSDSKDKDFILKAKYYGVIKGDENNNFNANENITKEDLVLYMERVFNLPDTVNFENPKIKDIFKDKNSEIYYAINKFYGHEVIEIDKQGNFHPNFFLTMGEMAKIANRLDGAGVRDLKPSQSTS